MFERNRVLISYDDSVSNARRDLELAHKLAQYLQTENVEVEVAGYSNTELHLNTYQWLIVIYSSHAMKSQIALAINTALDQVIERSMRGVMLVLKHPTDLPKEWATIRAFYVLSQAEEHKVFENILHALAYVKVPYIKDKSQQGRSRQIVAFTNLGGQRQEERIFTRSRFIIGFILLLLVMFIGASGIFAYFNPGFFQYSKINPSKLSSVSSTTTAYAFATPGGSYDLQQLYSNVTSMKPIIMGFQQSNIHWNVKKVMGNIIGCESKNDTYHARSNNLGQYTICLAESSNFKNFAYQITLSIIGDAGGVIFLDGADNNYYRFSVSKAHNGNDTYSIYYCQNRTCVGDRSGDGQELRKGQVKIGQSEQVTLTVITQKGKINLYIDGQEVGGTLLVVGSHGKPSVTAGKIGVFAERLSAATLITDLTFSNLKIWLLDK